MYLLDTNVISEARKASSGRADPSVIAWVDSISPVSSFISALTILELEDGALRIERRDSVQGQIVRDWLDLDVLPAYEGRILSIDAAVAQQAARLRVPDRRPLADSVIAATALVNRLALVTRNTKDFQGITGLRLINPWEPRDTPSG